MANLEKWFLITLIRIFVLIAGMMTMGISCQKKETVPSRIEDKLPSANIENNRKLTDLNSPLDLKNHIPISKSTLEKSVPNQVGEYLKTRTLIGQKESVDISSIQASYYHISENSKTILIDIMDGAGPVASVLLAGSRQKLDLDFEEVKPDGFSRILDRKGKRVWEAEKRREGIAELEFIHADRFLVSVKGNKLRHEELWVFVEMLDFKGLK